ncbi:hypothetical protein [Trichlorobacter ammonificans]|uniref:Uncharacterized protein n=1 Tax=Trichlorobacter ammonificans TaxID=2916410 RepID=A0ABN8HGQ8_9BACT|nr:hypothetical protein [Trichlorobacter ammonificans]CAH2030304.1 conserved protein of unknown function [Trichlorobacter ammonificans]
MSAEASTFSSLAPHATITLIKGSRYGLDLRGYLKPGWSGYLAGRLADEQISVLRGAGRKISAITWEARFELEMPPLLKVPERLDYCAMASTPPAVRSTLPWVRLERLSVKRDSAHGGSLLVELTGPDQLGFLASLLRVFSFYSLFPVEMEIETLGATASNRFWLKGIGSLTPTAEDQANLATALRKLSGNGGTLP